MAGLPGIVIRLAGESSGAVRAINETNAALGGVGSASSGAADKIRAMQGPALAALGAIGAGAAVAVSAASELEQASGAMAAVFGDQTAAMEKAAESANTLGLSTADYSQQASVLGALLKNSGVATDELAGSTESLMVTAADMAAQFGGSTSDGVEAISSALKGSYEVLDNYGVKLTAAQVSAYAMENGVTNAEAALALMNEQLEQTGTAGAAEREMGTLASQTATAKAAFDDASAALGTALLPYIADAAGKLADMAAWVGENSELVMVITGVVAAFAAAIIAMNVAMTIYTVIQWAANTALFSFPVIWIVLGIMAIIAAVVLLWRNWDKITGWMKSAFQSVKDTVGNVVGAVKGFFSGLRDDIISFVNGIIDNINRLIDGFNKLPGPDIPNIPTIGSRSGAARSLGAGTLAPAAGAGTVQITVHAGVADPAGVAREIRRLLATDAVRAGWR